MVRVCGECSPALRVGWDRIDSAAMSDGAMKRVLVTGGAGFLGSHLVDRLVDRGGSEVVVLDRFDATYGRKAKEENLHRHMVNGAVRLLDMDVLDDGLDKALGDAAIDTVVHFASVNGVPGVCDDPIEAHRVNVSGALRILELARRRKVGHVVIAGRRANERELASRVPEDLSTDRLPADHWTAMAIAAERFAQVHAALHGMRVTILRMAEGFGPRERPDMPVHQLFDAVASGIEERFEARAPGDLLLTPVNDIISAVCDALSFEAGTGCRTLVLGGAQSVRVGDLRGSISAIVKGKGAVPVNEPVHTTLVALWAWMQRGAV